MRLHVIVAKQRPERSTSDQRDVLIDTDAYWLSRDSVFMHDNRIGYSHVADVRRLDGRFHIARYEHDEKSIAINVYVVYPLNEIPLLVGVMGKIYPKDDDKIIFELPLSDDERALSVSKNNGFEIDMHDFNEDPYSYIDPDIIDIKYHNGRQRTNDYPDITYRKLISKTLEVLVFIDYTAGAEEI